MCNSPIFEMEVAKLIDYDVSRGKERLRTFDDKQIKAIEDTLACAEARLGPHLKQNTTTR
ncbi:hypothetical protein SNOG_16180 [Parastagonospora nodorum SN15]|uniref:Uncharacterized protein n=1 Tax=Phaeosphaeria nodorum (strain SN15 / ATCC MYA-4574 / FGSC 10173) TaxID=321614 RepID=Q0TW55_PHANO|nr:hypothetical protein SNOG_16180 [Parastagonospora nodorum SN15]EAT76364.1 hypothetical protein SNOG_16180 [Parastagonospora nodorum SN15]